MDSFYFSFGQAHAHRVNGKTFDCNSLVEIKAKDSGQARDIMFENFGPKWSMQYNNLPDMDYFPRGVIPLSGRL